MAAANTWRSRQTPNRKVFAVNSMSVEQTYTLRAYFMLCLCIIKNNNPLDPLAYGWVMFRKMQFVLSVAGTEDVPSMSKTKREAVNIITKNFFDFSNKHSLLKPLSGLSFWH